jgi:hypothetical protein
VHQPDRQKYRQIAAETGGLVEDRTVRDYLTGRRTPRATTQAVIKAALAKLGIPDPRAAVQL